MKGAGSGPRDPSKNDAPRKRMSNKQKEQVDL